MRLATRSIEFAFINDSLLIMNQDHETIILKVPDLTEALVYFTERLQFRVDMIVPADDLKIALISGQGMKIRLVPNEPESSLLESPHDSQEFIISRASESDAWHEGRAGMQYRDLIPNRLGGRVIASHIRIPDGGDVPDYVHYHKINFQMIYCRAGWARLVYEDQGEPFVMRAGDCVLQPPEIRHRVLESSAGLEVIEIGSPAIHETWADHELELPTKQVLPERIFSGQRFLHHQASAAEWMPWGDFEVRDTGIAAATNGMASARVLRAKKATTAFINGHTNEFLFYFVLNGELEIESKNEGAYLLQSGDSCVIPKGKDYSLLASTGLEFLEVLMPS